MKLKALLSTLVFFVATSAFADGIIKTNESDAKLRRVPMRLVDATDGETEETGIALAAGECKISKLGATSPAWSNCGGTLTHVGNGNYYYEASTGDIDTAGMIIVYMADAAAKAFTGTAQIVNFDLYTATQTVLVSSGTGAGQIALTSGKVAIKDGGIGPLSGTFAGQTTGEGTNTIDGEVGEITSTNLHAGEMLVLYSSAGDQYFSSCITGTATTNNRMTLANDAAALHTVGDYYRFKPNAGCLFNLATSELTACPASTASLMEQIQFIYMLSRNAANCTTSGLTTTCTIKRNNGSTTLCTFTATDDGTTLAVSAGS